MSIQKIVSRWDAGKVLFECEVPEGLTSGMALRHALEKAILSSADLRSANLRSADLRSANLYGANLSSADLYSANLRTIKSDFFDILLRAPNEVAGLRLALVEGRVDGSTYQGECACLVGTIANVRQANYQSLGSGISPDSSRAAEQWFMSIKKGDTVETNQVSKITVEWVDEFIGLLVNIRATA